MALKNNIRFLKGKDFIIKSNFFKGQNTKIDERLLNVNGATIIENFKYSKGALEHARGLKTLEIPFFVQNAGVCKEKLPDNPTKNKYLFLYRFSNNGMPDEQLISVTADGDGYVHTLTYPIDHLTFATDITGNPVACNYNYNGKDIMLFSTDENNMFCYDGNTFTEIENSPSVNSICVCNERVFVTLPSKPNCIWFSDDYNPTNWNISLTEAGYINFSDELGKTLKVVTLNSDVLVFRDYGITKIYPDGNQDDFFISKMWHSASRIIGNSITTADNYVIFATQNKLFAVSSSGIHQLNINVEDLFANADFDCAVATMCKDDYFFAFRQNEKNAFTSKINDFNDTLLIFNVSDQVTEIIKGVDVFALATVNTSSINEAVVSLRDKSLEGKILAFDTSSGTLLNRYPFTRKYRSAVFNAGDYGKNKFLNALELFSLYDLELNIFVDNKKYSYLVKGGDYRKISVGKKFKEFYYELISKTEKAYILPPVFYIKKYD